MLADPWGGTPSWVEGTGRSGVGSGAERRGEVGKTLVMGASRRSRERSRERSRGFSRIPREVQCEVLGDLRFGAFNVKAFGADAFPAGYAVRSAAARHGRPGPRPRGRAGPKAAVRPARSRAPRAAACRGRRW